MTRGVVIRAASPFEDGARRLLETSHALMRALFPPESNHFLTLDELAADDILFFVADINDVASGCGALALCDGYGEIKSMFVDPEKRGARLGARILAHLENEARARGFAVLRLETGDELAAAQRLYLSQGYNYCGPFGAYADDPRSRYMEKKL